MLGDVRSRACADKEDWLEREGDGGVCVVCDLSWSRSAVAHVLERLFYGPTRVSLCIVTSSVSSFLHEFEVDAVRILSGFQHPADPTPLPTRRACVTPHAPRAMIAHRSGSSRGFDPVPTKSDGGVPRASTLLHGQDVDPASGPLPVFESGQSSEVLSGDRSWIGAELACQPSLGFFAGRFIEISIAKEPDVASTCRRSLNDHGAVTPRDSKGGIDRDVVKEDKGPAVASGRPDVDLCVLDVLRPCPGKGQRIEGEIVVPDHRPGGASGGQIRPFDSGTSPPSDHRLGVLGRFHDPCLSLPGPAWFIPGAFAARGRRCVQCGSDVAAGSTAHRRAPCCRGSSATRGSRGSW